jgi:hypothetical protein
MLLNWSLEDLLARADRVVIGRVASQRSVEENGRVLTESVVHVERTLLGNHSPSFVLSQLGGRKGHLVIDVVGTARLAVGQRTLFVTHEADDGRRYLVGMALGAYDMQGDRLEQVVEASLVDVNGSVSTPPSVREAFLVDVIRALPRPPERETGAAAPGAGPPQPDAATKQAR